MLRLSIEILLMLALYSCTQVNTESKDYYESKKGSWSHGFIPQYTSEEIQEFKLEETQFNPKAAKRGKKLYNSYCMKCHGRNGDGRGVVSYKFKDKPINLRQAVKSTPNFKFFIELSNGTSDMPGWLERKFTDRELSDITQYLRSFNMK